MWLVNAALRRPFFVWVGMLLVVILGGVSYQRTPTDILPHLKVPVVVVFASYRGMPAPDMEQSVVAILERALNRCDRLEHIESRSILGIGIIKVFFRSEVDPDLAASQVISMVNGEMQNLPPGMLPPTILKYDASSIPVGNLVISSNQRDDKFLLDLADHQLKDELAGIEGLASAPVFGGVFRQVQIYVHPRTLEAMKLSPMDVARLVNNQSLVIPTGELRIGPQTYYVTSNSMMATPKDFEKIPLFTDGRKVVYLGDVAEVVDGNRWRTNTVRVDGRRAVYMPLLRQAGASAVRVVDEVKSFLPKLTERGVVPDDVRVEVAFDQSQYVREAMSNLRLEGVAGAVLASLVVLIFLGNWRSTWIVALSIPLSVLAAFAGLYFSSHTLNIMTLGGLALVLGRIVDDSIVDVENTVRHLNLGKTPLEAARDSAREIAIPVLMATITTVVVFLPFVFMEGTAKDLFTPLAFSAALAMFASYVVSRTVSPLCCSLFLRRDDRQRIAPAFDRFYERLGSVYERALRFCLRWRYAVLLLVAGVAIPAWFAFGRVGQELFPEVDAGEFTVHMRATGGPKVEETERQVTEIEAIIREEVPQEDLGVVLANIGVSSRWSAIYTVNNGPHAAFVRAQLRSGFEGRRKTTAEYVDRIRERLRERFPGNDFFFETGGMIRRILNAGAVAPIEVEVYGRDNAGRRALARELDARIAHLSRVRDTYMPQGMDLPQLRIDVDRTKAALLGFTENDILRNVITALMSSAQLSPNFWIEPQTGNPYVIGVQYPESAVEDIQTLENIPITSERGRSPGRGTEAFDSRTQSAAGPVARLLKDVATIERTQGPVEVFHQNVNRVSQLFVSVADNDLAGVAGEVRRIVEQYPLEYALNRLPEDKRDLARDGKFQRELAHYLLNRHRPVKDGIQARFNVNPDKLTLPKGVRMEVRGEVASMKKSFAEMSFTLILAVVLVYLVMAAQFSSWLDPFIMIVAAPLGLIGVAAMLWATGTSLNIQSFMGILMMVGISVSNSVLLVEFANRQRAAGLETLAAVVSAARIRLRPILMTTVATVAGLLPMAIHRTPGDEMNLPLARAVIGGLLGSTLLTLLVVPVLYVLAKPKGADPVQELA
jgi:multidrug efflux pump subunit AcrB